MSVVKVLFFGSIILFGGIGALALSKKGKSPSSNEGYAKMDLPVEEEPVLPVQQKILQNFDPDLPNIDRVFQLFTTGPTKFPIVETVEYNANVPWLKGRPAWLADYAAYYSTSKHFIARSLHGKPAYYSQNVSEGNRFNVFKRDKKIEFHLAVDISKLKLAFYYVDLDSHDRVLIKTYRVGLGRPDLAKPSGTLTPLGTYQLGGKVSQYKPGMMGYFAGRKTEMIQVFGSRWIPFETEISGCSEPAKGYGIHGVPWVLDAKSGELLENSSCIGKYDSDGCIRLLKEDMEELYAIIITKPTFIHIGKEFHDITLPGVEVATPLR